MIFDRTLPDHAPAGPCVPLGPHLPRAATAWPSHAAEVVKLKSAGRRFLVYLSAYVDSWRRLQILSQSLTVICPYLLRWGRLPESGCQPRIGWGGWSRVTSGSDLRVAWSAGTASTVVSGLGGSDDPPMAQRQACCEYADLAYRFPRSA